MKTKKIIMALSMSLSINSVFAQQGLLTYGPNGGTVRSLVAIFSPISPEFVSTVRGQPQFATVYFKAGNIVNMRASDFTQAYCQLIGARQFFQRGGQIVGSASGGQLAPTTDSVRYTYILSIISNRGTLSLACKKSVGDALPFDDAQILSILGTSDIRFSNIESSTPQEE